VPISELTGTAAKRSTELIPSSEGIKASASRPPLTKVVDPISKGSASGMEERVSVVRLTDCVLSGRC
jgi:hypothetical protein